MFGSEKCCDGTTHWKFEVNHTGVWMDFNEQNFLMVEEPMNSDLFQRSDRQGQIQDECEDLCKGGIDSRVLATALDGTKVKSTCDVNDKTMDGKCVDRCFRGCQYAKELTSSIFRYGDF